MKRSCFAFTIGFVLCYLMQQSSQEWHKVTVASIDGDTSFVYFKTADSIVIQAKPNSTPEKYGWINVTFDNNVSPIRFWVTSKRK